MASDIEVELTDRMKPHPETQEFGCWVGRDELHIMFDAIRIQSGRDETIDWSAEDLRDEVADLRAAIREAKWNLVNNNTGKCLEVLKVAIP